MAPCFQCTKYVAANVITDRDIDRMTTITLAHLPSASGSMQSKSVLLDVVSYLAMSANSSFAISFKELAQHLRLLSSVTPYLYLKHLY